MKDNAAAAKLWRLAQAQEMIICADKGTRAPAAKDGQVIPSREAMEKVAREHPDLVARAGSPPCAGRATA